MTTTIDNRDDLIDSREVIERIEELEEARQNIADATENWPGSDEAEELTTLEALANEASQYSDDWAYGSTLIRRSYFVEYCKEMLEDCGELPKDLPSYIEVDWQATARNLEADYTTVDFDGVEYLIR